MNELLGTSEWGWAALIVLFLGFELKGLLDVKRGDTWSEVVRYFFGFSQRSPWYKNRIRQGVFLAIMVWFSGHIALGW